MRTDPRVDTPRVPLPPKRRRLASPQESAPLIVAAAEALGGISRRFDSIQADDTEGLFGKYVANRLREVKDIKLRRKMMYEIETVLYENI
jgi:hypothetical protein